MECRDRNVMTGELGCMGTGGWGWYHENVRTYGSVWPVAWGQEQQELLDGIAFLSIFREKSNTLDLLLNTFSS